MRGQTIKADINGNKFRRSTKHIKINGKAYQAYGAKKWNAILAMIQEATQNETNK